jgi:hypothetical protein
MDKELYPEHNPDKSSQKLIQKPALLPYKFKLYS